MTIGKTQRRTSFLLACAVVLMPPGARLVLADGLPIHIDIYTVFDLPVPVPASLENRTTVIYLDRILEIEAAMSGGLDSLPEDHRPRAAGQRLTQDLADELRKSWRVLLRFATGRQDRLTHLPVIILDGRAVWYGVDLRRAVTRYRGRKKTRGGQ